MSLADEIIRRGLDKAPPRASGPLWEGPFGEGPNGGVTQSLLGRFISCRERFRVGVIEGLAPAPQFNPRLEFGSIWHVCEEGHARGEDWQTNLGECYRKLVSRYRLQRDEIRRWVDTARVMFPHYVEFWAHHEDTAVTVPLLQERTFDVRYSLRGSGQGLDRPVRLRGRWDAVELVGPVRPAPKGRARSGGTGAGIRLVENKTKGDINQEQIVRQLNFDLQTMFYLVALKLDQTSTGGHLAAAQSLSTGPLVGAGAAPVRGVRYNVVRRPRHYQGKKENYEDFLTRLSGVVAEAPQDFFMRWQVEVTPGDVERFIVRFLDPALTQLCEWWHWMQEVGRRSHGDPFHPDGRGIHWQHPFGMRNILDEGGSTDLDNYLMTGSEVGLERAAGMFGELA